MAAGLIHPGRVVAVELGGPLVVVPQIGGASSFGPLPSTVPDLAVGEIVLVTSLGTSRDQLVVLGRMTGRVPEVTEIPGLAEQLAALTAHDTTQDGRLTAVEGKNTQQDGRLGNVESVNATQGTAISTNTTAVTAVRADTVGKATTKGDLLVATASGVVARRGVGATDQALLADPAQPDGVAWKTVKGIPVGLTGAVEATRYVGATTSGAPVAGTFVVGDLVVDRGTGDHWVCTVAGTPGTWVSRTKTAADRLTAQESYEKYGWTGSGSISHDTTPLITTWATANAGNSTRIASPNTTGIVTLGRAGRWSLGFVAYSNALYNAYTLIYMNWPNGAWLPIVDLSDGRWRGAGFGGAGQSWQQTRWTGWVTAAQAAQPIRFYGHQLNPNAEVVSYFYGLNLEYMGGA
jgi:hypothetical protein